MEKNSSTQVWRQRSSRRFVAWIAIALFSIASAACGIVKVAYRNADTVGLLWIDRYLDLTSEQQEFVKPRLRELVEWHRTTQLPDYIALATDLQKRALRSIAPSDVTAIRMQFKQRAETLGRHALPDMADLALRLTPDNVKAMQDKFADNDDKFRRDNYMKGAIEKQQKARYEKALERVEEWYGSFNREQRAEIRRLSDARPLNNEILLAERQRRERELVALLARVVREQPSRETVIGLLRNYDERFELNPDRDKRAFQESLHKATDEMNAAIHNLATTGQRERTVEKLQEWIDDFRSMSSASS